MKSNIIHVSVGICISLLFFQNLNANTYLFGKIPNKYSPELIHNKASSSPSATKSLLFEQMGNPSGENGILSHKFFIEPMNSCQASDDFIVPWGEDWFIETIHIEGILFGSQPLEMVNLFIYHDAGGMPGPEIFSHFELPIIPSVTGNLEINLPGAPVFLPGKYWLSVQAITPADPIAEWYWSKEDSPTVSDELHWRNPLGGLGGPPFWMPGSVIWAGSGLEDWNLSFSIAGMSIPIFFPPIILDFYPPDCFPGEIVSLYGVDFGPYSNESFVEIDGIMGQDYILSWENDTVLFEVPLIPGGDSVDIRIISGPLISNEIRLAWNIPEVAHIIEPSGSDIIYWDTLHISVVPETYSRDIDSARFYYRLKGTTEWNYLGTDTCGKDQYIGTYNPVGEGDGWAFDWDVSSIQEDTIEIRTDMFDRFGHVLTGSETILIDKNPPIPFILDSSMLVGNKALVNDSIFFYYKIVDNKVNNGVLFNMVLNDFDNRDVEKVCQWDQSITINGNCMKGDICGPTAGASCLKWLAKEYDSLSLLAKTDIERIIGFLTTKSETQHGNGTTAGGIMKGMKKVYKRGTGKTLITERYPKNRSPVERRYMLENMLQRFKNKWDVLLEIRQRNNNGEIVGHWVTMSSYHVHSSWGFDYETMKYVTNYSVEVDFMDPGTGETTWAELTNDTPPQLKNYNIDEENHDGNAWIENVVAAKPPSTKKDIPPLNYIATIPIPDTGIYRFAIAANDLEDGMHMFEFFTQSVTGDTLASVYFAAYVKAYHPTAFFSSNKQYGHSPLTVEFVNYSTPKDSITYYEWDFGDGNTSNAENPVHTYTSNGIYDVSLIVSDGINYDTLLMNDFIHVGTILDCKVFLEGPFNGSEMNANLNQIIPMDQPYFCSPWFYTGDEQVDSIPDDSIVDWILVELRETPYSADSATGSTLIARKAAFIKSDGNVVDMDGRSLLYFDLNITDNLYVVIWHRNHLGVMSASPLVPDNSIYKYNFSIGEEKYYGGKNGAKKLSEGIWGMVAGDCNSDGQVNNSDKNDVWYQHQGISGYLNADMNMDSEVNIIDLINFWIPNSGNGSQIPGEIPQGGFKSMVPE